MNENATRVDGIYNRESGECILFKTYKELGGDPKDITDDGSTSESTLFMQTPVTLFDISLNCRDGTRFAEHFIFYTGHIDAEKESIPNAEKYAGFKRAKRVVEENLKSVGRPSELEFKADGTMVWYHRRPVEVPDQKSLDKEVRAYIKTVNELSDKGE
ncbi:hypothetical protein COV18_02565 [Candidatus Woesearchaeota archaeon CG10_big_fil_rev_8_21_14_0_10_37_12]|nr:MAG: hypothetical protein COV18_02565 [Candidatus Woesearchaeota archaeon CG10_big_fil_rev_8_21_14_0_10_37_12]